jgi:hypothetical protein
VLSTLGLLHHRLLGDWVVKSSTSGEGTRAPRPLAEARTTPIDRIPARTRAAVLSRIVAQKHLVSTAFQSSI